MAKAGVLSVHATVTVSSIITPNRLMTIITIITAMTDPISLTPNITSGKTLPVKMADEEEVEAGEEMDEQLALAEKKRKRTFKKFSYRGIDLDKLYDLPLEDLLLQFTARARRRLTRGLKRKHKALSKKLKATKKGKGSGMGRRFS